MKKIGLISKTPMSFTPKDIVSYFTKKGVEVQVFNQPLSLDFETDAVIQDMASCDLVYYRTGYDGYTILSLLNYLHKQGVYIVNQRYLEDSFVGYKSLDLFIAKEVGVPVIPTLFLSIFNEESYAFVKEKLGTPFIVKGITGTHGNHVSLVSSFEEFRDAKETGAKQYMAQQYIENSGDYRTVLTGENAFTYQRTAPPGEFRTSIGRGGVYKPVGDAQLEQQLQKYARDMQALLRLEVCSVDMIVEKGGNDLYLMETNHNTGWEGLEEALGVNLTAELFAYFESELG